MKDKRFWFGITVTLLWLSYMGYMLVTFAQPIKLNEWGDVFSGFFAPLAFLWLVIGYLQQGEELRHSTEALRLQAEELRNSVDQQSQLVAVSRAQMNQELDALQEERELRRDAARPKFVPQSDGSISTNGVTTHKLRLANVGNTATNVEIVFNPRIEAKTSLNHPLFRRDVVLDLQLCFGNTTLSEASISYIDSDGRQGEVKFSIEITSGGTCVIGKIERLL